MRDPDDLLKRKTIMSSEDRDARSDSTTASDGDIFVLGSGRSVLNLTDAEVQYINRSA
jgi:hypothetical protein